MALIWIEGFETFTSAANGLLRYGSAFTGTVAGAYGRTGNGVQNMDAMLVLPSNIEYILHGGAFMPNSTYAQRMMDFEDSGSLQCSLYRNNNDLQIRRGASTVLDTAVNCFPTYGNWYYLEVKLRIHDTLGSYEIRIDGSPVMSGSGVDLTSTANNYITQLEYISDTDDQWDDIYIINWASTGDFLGDVKVYGLLPDGDSSVQFTPLGGGSNYVEVDEANNDNDTTYNESSTTNHKDLFTFANLPGGVPSGSTIYGVQLNAYHRKTDAGTVNVNLRAKSGSTEGASGSIAQSNTYDHDWHVFENNPDTATLWTVAEVNAALFGYQRET